MQTIDQYMDGVKLPTMPEVAQSLIRSLNDDDIPFEKVRNAISKDPALTAKLIRLANSARFGLPRAVSSLDDAIALVGLNQVRTLGLAACMSDACPVVPGINRNDYWKESMACAGFSQWLAKAVGTDTQQSWLTGFMARLGELIIGQKSPTLIPMIEQLPHHPGGRWEREKLQLGFTEGHVSAELARKWNFPPEVVKALAASSEPLEAKPFSRLGAIVHIATLLAEIGIEETKTAQETIDALPAEVLTALQLNHDWLKENLPDAATFADTSGL